MMVESRTVGGLQARSGAVIVRVESGFEVSDLCGEQDGQVEISKPILDSVGRKIAAVDVSYDVQEASRIVEATGHGECFRDEE
jgi:hypothetical protein